MKEKTGFTLSEVLIAFLISMAVIGMAILAFVQQSGVPVIGKRLVGLLII